MVMAMVKTASEKKTVRSSSLPASLCPVQTIASPSDLRFRCGWSRIRERGHRGASRAMEGGAP